MKLALVGHGTMGKLIRTLAEERGFEIAIVIDGADSGLSAPDLAKKLKGVDVAIDFSTTESVRRNVAACVAAGVPIVEGTTGWNDQRIEIERMVTGGGGALVFGANFSIGVNLFYRVVDHAAGLFAKFPEYEIFIEEQHHSRKKDAPSGTALELKDIVARHTETDVGVASTRAGNIPGTHRVGFAGESDHVLLEHVAGSRLGFARGALVAAEWIVGKRGIYEFTDVMDEIIGG